MATPERYELTREETDELLAKQVRRYLKISLREFFERMNAGTLPDHPALPHLIMLAGEGR